MCAREQDEIRSAETIGKTALTLYENKHEESLHALAEQVVMQSEST